MKIHFKQWDCEVKKYCYENGNTALLLIDQITGELIATASVNLIDNLPAKQVYIKTWSENEGIYEALLQAGVIRSLDRSIEVNQFGSIARLAEVLC